MDDETPTPIDSDEGANAEDNASASDGDSRSVMEKLYHEAEAALDAAEAAEAAARQENAADDAGDGTGNPPPAGVPEDGNRQETPSSRTAEDNPAMFALKQEIEKNRAGWQRALADFQNYKRRTERELTESRQRAAHDTLRGVLPVIDDFERALANVPEDLQGNPWMNGVELILKKLNKLLEEHEVAPIDPVGQPFDPNQHEAIGVGESDEVESGHVMETLQKGYIANGRVLRPALVRVAS